MRRAAALLWAAGWLCSAAAVSAQALRPEETRLEKESVERVTGALRLGDCPRAVQELNRGLKARYPGIYLLAGSMYEGGVCLKPNWERAERLYLQAAEAGHEGGRLRLVAGLADGPRDVGAALWWLQQSRVSVPAACRVADFVASDPDAFVLTLNRWDPARVQMCLYAGGVMAQLVSDIDYPNVAISFGESARVLAEFLPAQGRIEVRTLSRKRLDGQYGLTAGEDTVTANSRKVGSALETHVREASARALARFPRPAAMPADLPPDLKLETTFEFRLVID